MSDTKTLTIALGGDHRGAAAIAAIRGHLKALGHEAVPMGRISGEPCDYPDGAYLVGRAVVEERADWGILACGSGIGVSIAANKVPGVRAAFCVDAQAADMTRRHNDANVLCLSGDRTPPEDCLPIVDAFLAGRFEGDRHARRVAKIAAIERGENPADVNAPK
ncbi:MAG: RpiB/LacA/LacB family sugar-phosphate isomerase [Phycisphaerales bacterium]|nr:MAG: RpiB/LacA/LacB family sugar-phosphate isomerase [Phycisphaerales bacterium]